MNKTVDFQAWLDELVANSPRTETGVPLLGYNQLHWEEAQSAPLICALADIIEATCVLPAVVSMAHATAA